MADPLKPNPQDSKTTTTCGTCGRRSKKGWSFGFKKPAPDGESAAGVVIKCFRCASRHTPMLRRSFTVAIVVGSILTLLNQGDILFSGSWKDPLYWKIPLTYSVPFMVATYGALSNGRR